LAQDIGRARIPRRGTQFRNSGILKILRIEEFRSAKIRAGPDCLLGTDKGCRPKPDSRSCPPAQLLPPRDGQEDSVRSSPQTLATSRR